MKYILKQSDGPRFCIDYEKELNSEQFRVVTAADGPCLVLAGAGSGKTRTLVYRVAYLLEKGVDPRNILLLTFTNKAAREMLERVKTLVGFHPKGLWGGTFHHVANIILRRHSSFTIIDENDAQACIRHIVKELGLSSISSLPKPSVIKSIISFSINSKTALEECVRKRTRKYDREIEGAVVEVARAYEEKKRISKNLDFDDLLFFWLKLLKENQKVRDALSEQFQYILVDEYQDTNRIQADIVRFLGEKHKNIFVVGDDAQSIYSFRAAEVGNILRFEKEYPNAKVFHLETNYRSTPEILSLATHSINHNTEQYKKQLKAHLGASKQKPALVRFNDSRKEAEFIAQRVLELRDEGDELQQIAVLFRSVFQSLELELELNRRKIPYVVRGGLRFFEQAHIKDAVAYLKLLKNMHDELSWMRILLMEQGIGESYARKLVEHTRNFNSLEELLDAGKKFPLSGQVLESWMKVISLLELLWSLENRENASVSLLIKKILSSSYKNYLEKTFENSRDRLEDLEELIRFSSELNLDDFLSQVMLSEGFRAEAGKRNERDHCEQLVLSTIHQAKGLEWKSVFVIGLCEGQFPHRKSSENSRELEEERRLFYVACTRAQRSLYLTYSMFSPSSFAQNFISRPSQFLRELDEHLYERLEVEEEGDVLEEGGGILDKVARGRKKDYSVRYVYEE